MYKSNQDHNIPDKSLLLLVHSHLNYGQNYILKMIRQYYFLVQVIQYGQITKVQRKTVDMIKVFVQKKCKGMVLAILKATPFIFIFQFIHVRWWKKFVDKLRKDTTIHLQRRESTNEKKKQANRHNEKTLHKLKSETRIETDLERSFQYMLMKNVQLILSKIWQIKHVVNRSSWFYISSLQLWVHEL